MIPFRRESPANGIVVEFFDCSNRYFGDYHRVCIEVRLQIPRPGSEDPLIKRSTLERMGVAGSDMEMVRDRLAADYWRHAGRYLTLADYPARLLAGATASRHRLQPLGL